MIFWLPRILIILSTKAAQINQSKPPQAALQAPMGTIQEQHLIDIYAPMCRQHNEIRTLQRLVVGISHTL